jgi:hypothetical protein
VGIRASMEAIYFTPDLIYFGPDPIYFDPDPICSMPDAICSDGAANPHGPETIFFNA